MNGFHLPGAPLPVPAMSARMPLPPYARHGYMPIAPMFRPQDILQMERIYVRGIIPQARMHAGQVADRALREAALSAVMLLRDVEANIEGAAPANPTKQAAKDAGAWMMSQADMPEHARDRVHVVWVAKALIEAGALQDDGGVDVQKARDQIQQQSYSAEMLEQSTTSKTAADKQVKARARAAKSALERFAQDPLDERKRKTATDAVLALLDVTEARDSRSGHYLGKPAQGVNLRQYQLAKGIADKTTEALALLPSPVVLPDEADMRALDALIGSGSPVKAFTKVLLSALDRAGRYRTDPRATESLRNAVEDLSSAANSSADTGEGVLAGAIADEVRTPSTLAPGMDAQRKVIRARYVPLYNKLKGMTTSGGTLPIMPVRGLILIRKLLANPGDENARIEARSLAGQLKEIGKRLGDVGLQQVADLIDAATR